MSIEGPYKSRLVNLSNKIFKVKAENFEDDMGFSVQVPRSICMVRTFYLVYN